MASDCELVAVSSLAHIQMRQTERVGLQAGRKPENKFIWVPRNGFYFQLIQFVDFFIDANLNRMDTRVTV